VDQVVYATTVSPAVDDQGFTGDHPRGEVEYLGKKLSPICSRGTPYVFFAKRGTVNKLVVYYQGGGPPAGTTAPASCRPTSLRRPVDDQPEQRPQRLRGPERSAQSVPRLEQRHDPLLHGGHSLGRQRVDYS